MDPFLVAIGGAIAVLGGLLLKFTPVIDLIVKLLDLGKHFQGDSAPASVSVTSGGSGQGMLTGAIIAAELNHSNHPAADDLPLGTHHPLHDISGHSGAGHDVSIDLPDPGDHGYDW